MIKRKYLVIVALVLSTSVGYGTEQRMDTHGDGTAIYEQYCTVCHGRNGEADTPLGRILVPRPRNLADPIAMARIDDTHIHEVIRDGKPGTSMPAWNRILDAQQIADVATYIKQLKRPRPAGMTQADFDARVGGEIYQSYCSICHGNMGNARTKIGNVLTDKPRDFTDPGSMAKLSNEEMARAIAFGRPGTAMVAWQTILTQEDIRRLVLFIRQFVPAK